MNAVVLALVLIASPAPAPSSLPATSAVIANSGSTNTAGYRIVVATDGRAQITQGTTTRSLTIPAALATQFYTDLAAAGPLDAMPARSCMKSASFGTTTVVTYAEKTSPDLQCSAQGDAAKALAADVRAITTAVNPVTRRRLQPVLRRPE